MKISIELTYWFKRFTGGESSFQIEVDSGCNAYDAAASIGIPREEIGFLSVTGEGAGTRMVDESYTVRDGDVIKVYPLIMGG